MQANYGHILALSLSLFLAGCCGIQGHVNEVDANGNVVVPIAGAEVTFRRANGSTRRATTNQAGHYRRWLTGGNYFISVNHIGHASYDSAPSTVSTPVLGLRTRNIQLNRLSGTTVVVVRHAERADGSTNSNLAPDSNSEGIGVGRAERLGTIAANANADAVYVTGFCRTAQTGQPAAIAQGVSLQVQGTDMLGNCDPEITVNRVALPASANTASGLANRILSQNVGDVVLVVGHSNTVPGIVQALSGTSVCPTFIAFDGNQCHIASNEFDHMFVVNVPASGTPTVTHQTY